MSLYGLRLSGARLEDGAASGIRRGARGGLELGPGRGAGESAAPYAQLGDAASSTPVGLCRQISFAGRRNDF